MCRPEAVFYTSNIRDCLRNIEGVRVRFRAVHRKHNHAFNEKTGRGQEQKTKDGMKDSYADK